MTILFIYIFCTASLFASSTKEAAAKEIVSLVNRRFDLVERAARWKWNHGCGIRDNERRSSVHFLTLRIAKDKDLQYEWVDQFIDLILEQSERYQKYLFKTWREEGISLFPHPDDLRQVTDLQIDALTEKLLNLIVQKKSLIREPQFLKLMKAECEKLPESKQCLLPLILNYISPGRRPTGKPLGECTIKDAPTQIR